MSQSPRYSFHTPQPTKSVIGVIALCAVCWLAAVIFEPLRAVVSDSMLIDATTLPDMQLWGVLTHAFFPRSFLSLALECAMIYLFGSDISRRMGEAKWLGTILLATCVGGALGALVAWPFGDAPAFGGPGAALTASLAIYCWHIWDQRSQFFGIELTGKMLLGIFLLIDLVFALVAINPISLVIRLSAAGIGLLIASGTWRPTMLRRQYHYWRVKRNLKIVSRTPESDRSNKQRKDGTWIN